ncbi:MAG: NUDIX domain-containing protein [Patescibacteria group bacterium]|nr:NUDIX domain-containing protein [Patescibacteria group bacterium]
MSYPEPTVGAFIRNKKGDVLLVKSPKWGNGKLWTVAGGHVEINETIEKAVEREIKEELGIDVFFQKVFAVFESIFDKNFFKKKHFIFLECECFMAKDQQIKVDGKEITEAKWFTLNKALKLNLEKYTKRSLKLLL